MNERLKELELLAYIEVEREYIDPSNNMPYKNTGKEFSREKFAELIVKECITQCQSNDVSILDQFSDERDDGIHFGVQECMLSIKQHFGVK